MATFQHITHEDFSGLMGPARHIDTTSSTTHDTVDVMSPFIDNTNQTNGSIDKMIQNCFAINQAVTPSYNTKNASGDTIFMNWDWSHKDNIPLGNSELRGPCGAHYFAGRFQQDKTSGNTVFTSSTVEGQKTDGYVQIQEPYMSHGPQSTVYHKDHSVQTGIRIKLQFNDLAPFEWVPLFGISRPVFFWGDGDNFGGQRLHTPDALEEYYANHNSNATTASYRHSTLGYQKPGALISNATNVWGSGNTGADFGWASNYGDRNVVYFIYCHDGSGNALLATCGGMTWNGNSPNFEPAWGNPPSSETGTNPTNGAYGVSNGLLRWTQPQMLTDLFTTSPGQDLQAIWDTYKGNFRGEWARLWQGVIDTDHSNSSWASHYHNSSIIGYKSNANNADLSSPEEIYVNIVSHAPDHSNPYRYHSDGVNWGMENLWFSDFVSNRNHHGSHEYYATGKIGDFTFVNQFLWHGFDYTRETETYLAPKHLILQPSSSAEGIIHEFGIGSYEPTTRHSKAIQDGPRAGFLGLHNDLEYIYPGPGNTYDPLHEIENDPGRLEDIGNAWDNATNLVDRSDLTYATVKSIGEANALYIKLAEATTTSVPGDADIVQEFTITLRGLIQEITDSHEIMFALCESDKTEIGNHRTTEKTSIRIPDGETAGSGVSYPRDDLSGFIVTFRNDTLGSGALTYGKLKNGYLKVWAQIQPGSSAS